MHPDLQWPWLQETNLSPFEEVLSCCLGRTPRTGNAVHKKGLVTKKVINIAPVFLG